MKYIRTKDGIYKATEINGMIVARGGVAYSCDIADVHYPIVFKEKDIIKQADTIEELCDELVLKDLDTEMCFVMNAVHIQDIRDNWKNLMNNDYLKNHTIYGAIWTDRGLIYVAKMNEKGELELL